MNTEKTSEKILYLLQCTVSFQKNSSSDEQLTTLGKLWWSFVYWYDVSRDTYQKRWFLWKYYLDMARKTIHSISQMLICISMSIFKRKVFTRNLRRCVKKKIRQFCRRTAKYTWEFWIYQFQRPLPKARIV